MAFFFGGGGSLNDGWLSITFRPFHYISSNDVTQDIFSFNKNPSNPGTQRESPNKSLFFFVWTDTTKFDKLAISMLQKKNSSLSLKLITLYCCKENICSVFSFVTNDFFFSNRPPPSTPKKPTTTKERKFFFFFFKSRIDPQTQKGLQQ